MANLPVVGVIACTRPVEGEAAQIVKERYLLAVRRHAEALPVILPSNLLPGDMDGLLPRLDAVLLTGSNSNIEPSRYGSPLARRGPADGPRDDTTARLIEAAVKEGKPLFGICRGLQEINVAFGGTIEDERENGQPELSHHAPEDANLEAMFGYGHAARVVAGGAYEKEIGTHGEIDVNSVHFQRIGKLGQGLAATVESLDGVVEGVVATGSKAPVFAVQWHPEWRPEERPHDLAFWHYLGRVARGETG